MSQLEQSLLKDPDALEDNLASSGKRLGRRKKNSRGNDRNDQKAKQSIEGKRVKMTLLSESNEEMTKEEAGKRTLEFLENEIAMGKLSDPDAKEDEQNIVPLDVLDGSDSAENKPIHHGKLPKYTEDELPSSSRQDFVSKEGGGDSLVESVAKAKPGKERRGSKKGSLQDVGLTDQLLAVPKVSLLDHDKNGNEPKSGGFDISSLKRVGSLEQLSDEAVRQYIHHANSEEGDVIVEEVAKKGEESANEKEQRELRRSNDEEPVRSIEHSAHERNPEATNEDLEGEYTPADSKEKQDGGEKARTKKEKEPVTVEGEFSRISVEEARQAMEEAGKTYASLRGREDKIRNRLPKFLLSLVGKGEKTDATEQERIWRGAVSKYQQLRLEEIRKTATTEKWSADHLKKEMAELVRETDIRARLAAISHYDNAKWGESGETWKTRLLGRSKKFAEEYRTFCKEHKAAAFALRGGLLLGSGALGGVAFALPMGVLMRALGSYGAARALKEFFDRRANEKLVVDAEQSEALQSVEKMVVTPENLTKFQEQLRKLDVVEQFEGFRKGAKRRAKWAIFVGGGLFLGGMALSHFAHAAQGVVETKSAVSVSDAVKGLVHDVGGHVEVVEPAAPAIPEMPVNTPGIVEGVLPNATESATQASLESAPLVVHAGKSIEGTIVEHLTGTGMDKEEAGKVAHRIALMYAREHHIPFKDLNIVQPDTKFSIIPNPDNIKTPFRISGDITFGPKVHEVPAIESQPAPQNNDAVSLDDHRVIEKPSVSKTDTIPNIGKVLDEWQTRLPANASEMTQESREILTPKMLEFRAQLGMLNMPNVESAARTDILNLFMDGSDRPRLSEHVFRLLFPNQRFIGTELASSFFRHVPFDSASMTRVAQISSALRQLSGYEGSANEWLFQRNETLGDWLRRISEAIMKSSEYQSHIASALKKSA